MPRSLRYFAGALAIAGLFLAFEGGSVTAVAIVMLLAVMLAVASSAN